MVAVPDAFASLPPRLARLRLALPRPTKNLMDPHWSDAGFLLALERFGYDVADGVAAIRASGHATPISPVLGWIGVVNLLLAPFGAFALTLAAITAAICMGREAHEDPARRYTAAIAAGLARMIDAPPDPAECRRAAMEHSLEHESGVVLDVLRAASGAPA